MNPSKPDIKTFINEYRAFHDAKQRCRNKKHPRFSDWGGRGIEFRFQSFAEFLDCVGPRPTSQYSIDREDNNGHYEPGNVKWSLRSKQQHNKRVSKTNKFGVTGIRQVAAKGLITPTYQVHITVDGKFKQLYCGPSLEEAIKAQKEYEVS